MTGYKFIIVAGRQASKEGGLNIVEKDNYKNISKVNQQDLVMNEKDCYPENT